MPSALTSDRSRSQLVLDGEMPRLSPLWMPWAYASIVISFVGALVYATVHEVKDTASGPAVVRMAGRIDLSVVTAGTVKSIDVHAGQRVEAGQLLVQFVSAPEQHELERAAAEHDAALVKVLRDPGDETTRKELARAQAQRTLAEAKMKERALKAPRAGTVREVRIRVGQVISPGDIVLTLVDGNPCPTLVAILPAYAQPQLHPGMIMKFTPKEFDELPQDLVIQSVGDEVLGPSEIRRYLGPELADAPKIEEPSVIVTALLPGERFKSRDKLYPFTQGLPGRAKAELRTRRLLVALLPEIGNFLEEKNVTP